MKCSGELKDFKRIVILHPFTFTLSIFNSNIMKTVNWFTAMLLLLYIAIHVGFRFVYGTVRQYFYSFHSTP